MIDPIEIEKLSAVALETKEKLKKAMQEKGPDSVPPILIMVKKSEKDLDEGKAEAIYIGAAIDPDDKEEGIAQVLAHFPALNAYAVIMHANSWLVEKNGEFKDLTYDEIKQKVKPKDTLVVTLVMGGGKAKILSLESYVIEDGGRISWTEETPPQEGFGQMDPAYHRPLVSEEDFE